MYKSYWKKNHYFSVREVLVGSVLSKAVGQRYGKKDRKKWNLKITISDIEKAKEK